VNPIAVVVQREFLATVRRRSYLIVTFGMPFFLSMYLGLAMVAPAFYMAQGGARKKASALVDEAGFVRMEEIATLETDVPDDTMRGLATRLGGTMSGRTATGFLERTAEPARLVAYPERGPALEALRARVVDRVYVIPRDYLETGAIESYERPDATSLLGRARGRESLRRLLGRSLMAGVVPDALRPRIERPIRGDAARLFTVKDDGTVVPRDFAGDIARFAIPGIFAALFLMSVMVSAGYLLQGVAEEKENRVIEVILSSVRPDQLLFGKLLGLGAAGLLQLAVWISVASMATSLLAATALALLDFKLFAGCLLFFVAGFLMLGSLMTGTAALGSSARESQQLAAIWSTITVMPPALTFTLILDVPNGAMARALGWFPLTAPITMMLRLGTGQVPWWDVLVSAALLAAGVYLAIRVSGALMRLGLLMYGKRPTLREILRQLRHA
jgi:ABC-2 type transport system permease protein